MTAKTEVKTVKVAIAGINGRMGRATAKAMMHEPGFKVVGAFGRSGAGYVGKDIAQLAAMAVEDKTGILVSNGFLDCLAGAPDVLLEWSLAESAIENAKLALERGIRPVIGVSGITPKQIEELSKIAADKKLGAMVVPNFSIGAVLMMEFAKQAAAMFEHVEIVEMHHTGKHDAPSGTSMHTARKLALAEKTFNQMEVDETELLAGSRGGAADAGVRIHSLRLPGLISHQEVIFGADGELLTIRHDSFNTNCFLKGIFLAIRAVMQLDRLVVGLDSVLPLGSKN